MLDAARVVSIQLQLTVYDHVLCLNVSQPWPPRSQLTHFYAYALLNALLYASLAVVK